VPASDLDYTIFRAFPDLWPDDQFVNAVCPDQPFRPIIPILTMTASIFSQWRGNRSDGFCSLGRRPKSISERYDLCGPEALACRKSWMESCGALGAKGLS